MITTSTKTSVQEYVAELVARARKAQTIADSYSQDQVDRLVTAVAWSLVKDPFPANVARLAVEETHMGKMDSKHAKMLNKVKGTLFDMKGAKTVGEIFRDEQRGIVKYAKPVGVIGAITPITNCEATPAIQALAAIKTRNALIVAPHPRAKRTAAMIVNCCRETLKTYGAPDDLVQIIESPSIEVSGEVMRQVDLIIATGGDAVVHAAYSSGTPAYGVGVGNAMIIIDETADLRTTANTIVCGKTFDNATSCSSENSLCIQDSIYDQMIEALQAVGGYLCNEEEKTKLGKALFRGKPVNPRLMGAPLEHIANTAGLTLPKSAQFLMVEETGIGAESPFSGEKLSLVTTLYRYHAFSEAIDMVNRITAFQGAGHSCGIHSNNENHILELSINTKVSRIMVRQPHTLANSGAWTNGMPVTMSLGCGTWGRNIATTNITWREFLNVTWVSYPIPSYQPSDEELFGEFYNT